MNERELPRRFYKVSSPYRRAEDENGHYVVDPDGEFLGVKKKFSWAFDRAEEVEAIEKLDGTNCAVEIGNEGGLPVVNNVATRMGDRRMNEVNPYGQTNHHYIARGVQNSVRRGYLDGFDPGWYFGELVGPKMQDNPHELDEHLLIPFEWLRDKCEYESYGKYPTDFESIRDWFRGEENGLFSLFASRMHGQDLEASLPINGTFVEGLILVHPDFDGHIHPEDLTVNDDGKVNEIVKLRRDMLSEFQNGEWPMDEYGH